ncbi:MAG: hypothetical protein K2P78_03930, partial [Gemmataceae bacterium]|nr:hypothetical protein [Gemmataceae bacterium]
ALAAGTAPAPEHAGGAVAVLTAGPAGGEVVVVRNGEVVFTRAVPAPVVASEPLLVGHVRRDLAVYAGQSPGHPVKAVYVAEVGLGGWANRLRTSLGVPVHAYDPLDGTAPDVPQTLRGRFAGAAGLLAAKAADTLPINFAAPRQPKAEANPKKQLALLAVLAALILVGAGGAFVYMLVSQADEDVAKLERQKATLKKDIADLEPVGKQYEAVEQWQTREVVWLDELYDMTDRFPSGGVLLTQLDATPILPDKTGKQDAQFRLSLRLSTTRPETVDALITAIEKDSGGKKFYRETDKKTQQDVMTVSTKVLRRDPSEYVRRPVFQTPPRKLYAPSRDDAAAKEKDAASPKGDEQPGEDIDP